MERRFLIAIILSFMVLYIWAAITPKPKGPTARDEYSQPSDIKEDTKQEAPLSPPVISSKPVEETITEKPVNEEIVTLESDKLFDA